MEPPAAGSCEYVPSRPSALVTVSEAGRAEAFGPGRGDEGSMYQGVAASVTRSNSCEPELTTSCRTALEWAPGVASTARLAVPRRSEQVWYTGGGVPRSDATVPNRVRWYV